MIIYKNKQYLKCSLYPNTDWIGNADYILDDEKDAELEEKIVELYPNFDFVFNEEGNITDVVKTEPVITEEQINECKQNKINDSKIQLAEWLNSNPMQFTDGKFYSVTEEKQALLNGNLASYERATKAGIDYPLKWNSTGDECTEWSYEDLLILSLSIAAYVAPRVSAQQALEIQIKNCTTMEELESIEIKYE